MQCPSGGQLTVLKSAALIEFAPFRQSGSPLRQASQVICDHGFSRRQPRPYTGNKRGEARMAGLYFEEFSVGQKFQHPIRRTVTEADNVFFTALTHNPAQLHLDEEYGKTTEFGTRIVNSLFTLGLMIGISVGETTLGTTVANLGMDEVRFPKPVFHGDTLRIESEVLELRESKSRPQNGIVIFAHRAFNQRDELVASCKRSALMLRKPA
ncbi:MAG TPA: MaoC family dehydratase [Rhizomicrobium sp.]|nr:MaoC family dehydratase [Rhizomicrobium sp.]